MAAYDDPSDETPKEDQDILDAANDFLKFVTEVENDQREREGEDLQFQIPDADHQWDDYAIAARSPQSIAGQNVPARPMLCVDTLSEPIALVENAFRGAHLGVTIHPLTEDATDDTAEVLQGLYRTIERTSRAHIARNWTFKRGVRAGRGIYRILTEYDRDSTTPGDQRIIIRRMLFQESAYLDPLAEEPDWSDGKRALVIERMPVAEYKRRFPNSDVSDFTPDQLTEYSANLPEWFGPGGETVTVGEWYTVTEDDNEIEIGEGDDTRKVPDPANRRHVRWHLLNGCEVLERRDLPGQYIPLIPYVANELIPVGGERFYMGMIRPARDGAKLTNYAASQAVTMAATEPQAPWMMEEGQEEGHEKEFELAGTMPLTMVRYKRTGLSGMPGEKPQRMQVDVSRMSVSMQLLQMGQGFVQQSTRTYDPALGKQPAAHRSGRALMALQDQTTEATSDYQSNMTDITMEYEAKVILDLIPHIYDRPGRVVTILDENSKPSRVMLNQPFQMQGKRPMAMPDATPEQIANPDHPAKHFDLNKGRYGVGITIGKSPQSRLMAGNDAVSQLLQAEPKLVPLIGPEWMQFQDFPGSKAIQKILTANRNHQFPWVLDANDPNKALAMAQQQIAMLTQQLQQAGKFADNNQTKVQIAQMDNQFDAWKARLEAETKIAVAEINKRQDVFAQELKRIGLQIDAAREIREEQHAARESARQVVENAKDRTHEAIEAHKDRTHEAALAVTRAAAQESDNASQE